MTIHVRPEPKTAEECIARIKEQREKIYNPQVRPAPKPELAPVPMPIVALSLPATEPLVETPKARRTRIIQEVADRHGISMDEMMSDDRRAHVVTARDAAILAVRQDDPRRSSTRIGQDFGGKDHTTIIMSLRRSEGLLSSKKTGRRYGQRTLAQMRLEDGIRYDLMKALCLDGWSAAEIADVMQCSRNYVHKITQELREELVAAHALAAEPAPETPAQPQPEPEVIPQPLPTPSPFRQLLSRVRNWFGARA